MKKLISAFLLSLVGMLAQAQMPSYTPNINLMVPAYAQTNWQVPTNYNWALIDKLLSGNLPLPAISVTGLANFPQLTTWQGSPTSYSTGQTVFYLGTFYASLSNANVGNIPGSGSSYWSTSTTGSGITSLTLAVPSWLTVTGSPLTGPGTITISSASVTANQFLASPNGNNGALAPRVIVPADLPPATNSTLGIVRPDNITIGQTSGVLSALSDARPSVIETTGKYATVAPNSSLQVFSATGAGTITYLHFTAGMSGSDWQNFIQNSTLTINCDGNPQIVTVGAFFLSQDFPAIFNTNYSAAPATTSGNTATFNRRAAINFYSSCTITLNNVSSSITANIFLDTTYRSGTPLATNYWNAFTMPLQAVPFNNNVYNYPQIYALPLTTFSGGGSLEFMQEYFNSSANYDYLESTPNVTADGNLAATANGHEDWYSSGYYCNASFGTPTTVTNDKWGCLIAAGLLNKAAAYDMVGYRWWTTNPADNLLFNSSLSISTANGGNDYGTPGTINWGSLITYFTNAPTIAQINFSPGPGTYSSSQNVTLSGGPSGDYVCYTINGSTPVPNGSGGCTTGSLYSSAVAVNSNKTLMAVGAKSGYNTSPVTSSVYIITSVGTVYINTTFNEASSGAALAGTTPTTVNSPATGSWTASADQPTSGAYAYSTNSTTVTGPCSGITGFCPVTMNAGTANYTLRFTLTGLPSNAQVYFPIRWTNNANFSFFYVNGGVWNACEYVSGTQTCSGSGVSFPLVTGLYTIVANGTSISMTNSAGTISGTMSSSNVSATNVGTPGDYATGAGTIVMSTFEVSSN